MSLLMADSDELDTVSVSNPRGRPHILLLYKSGLDKVLMKTKQPAGKEYSNWRRLDGAEEYLEALSADLRISRTDLLISIQGGAPWQ